MYRIDYLIDPRCLLSKNFPLYTEFRSFYLDIHYSCLISVAIVEVGIWVSRLLYRINDCFGTSDDSGLCTSGFFLTA